MKKCPLSTRGSTLWRPSLPEVSVTHHLLPGQGYRLPRLQSHAGSFSMAPLKLWAALMRLLSFFPLHGSVSPERPAVGSSSSPGHVALQEPLSSPPSLPLWSTSVCPLTPVVLTVHFFQTSFYFINSMWLESSASHWPSKFLTSELNPQASFELIHSSLLPCAWDVGLRILELGAASSVP